MFAYRIYDEQGHKELVAAPTVELALATLRRDNSLWENRTIMKIVCLGEIVIGPEEA